MSSKPRPELCWHIAEVRNIAINFAQVESPGITARAWVYRISGLITQSSQDLRKSIKYFSIFKNIPLIEHG